MSHSILCTKLKTQEEHLDEPPFPGEFGLKIFNHISKKAWAMWLAHQTMLINEYRLNMIDQKAKEFLRQEMTNYFFGEGSATPAGFVPAEKKDQ